MGKDMLHLCVAGYPDLGADEAILDEPDARRVNQPTHEGRMRAAIRLDRRDIAPKRGAAKISPCCSCRAAVRADWVGDSSRW